MAGKKIAVNALMMDRHKAGIGNYAYQLFQAMRDIPLDFQIDVHIQAHMKEYFSDSPAITFIPHRDFKNSRDRILYEQFKMPRIYNSYGYHAVHFIDYLSPLLPIKPGRLFTFHDLAFFELPDSFTMGSRIIKQFFTNWGIKRAEAVICVSHHTRKDLLGRYSFLDEERIKVIHLAGQPSYPTMGEKKDPKRILKEYGIYGKFILTVGTLEPRKNIGLLVDAYLEAVRKADIPHKLVLCGKPGWKYQSIMDKINNPQLDGRIIVTGYVPDQLLPIFYQQADLFVYPSLYEGFGIPPLEALTQGVPVITSTAASLPEVVGDAALTFPPMDKDKLAELMVQVLQDDQLKNSLREKGLQRAAGFSWKTTAEKTVAVYRKML